jgi:coenzyme F420-reducing hydrogenase beta subunit
MVDDLTHIPDLLGSKYVQSEIGESYKQVYEFLENGKRVLFSGTPCQIIGLKAFLQKDYENLLTQDIICHGTPSPGSWEKYLQHRINEARSGEIKKIHFREKQSDGSTLLKIEISNGFVYKGSYIEIWGRWNINGILQQLL